MISKFNTKLICVVFGAFFLALYSLSFGQALSVTGSLSKDTIRIADRTTLVYSFQKPDSIRIFFPDLKAVSLGDIEILSEPRLDSAEAEPDRWTLDLKVRITAFDTGLFYIPPVIFPYKGNGISGKLYSDTVFLKVEGVDLDTDTTGHPVLRDIMPPYSFKHDWNDFRFYKKGGRKKTFWEKNRELIIFSGLILLVLVILFLLYLKYFRGKSPTRQLFQTKVEKEPAYITAFRELDRIKAQKLWQQKQVKEYYTRITHVIRWYIEQRFDLMALEMTTGEILQELKGSKPGNVDFEKLAGLLNLADLVKFARGEADPEENLVHLDNAYDFVQRTRIDLMETADDTGSVENKQEL